MKIALLTNGIYPYIVGGMQKHSFYLAKFLAQNHVYVDLYHVVAHDQPLVEELQEFSTEELKYITNFCFHAPKPSKYIGHYVVEAYQYSSVLYAYVKDKLHTYDFIYGKGFPAWKFIVEKRKGETMAPIGVKFHGYEMFQVAPSFRVKLEHFLLSYPVKWVTVHADCVFSYGQGISTIVESLGVKKENIYEVPTGIDKKWINKKSKVTSKIRKFIFLGRFERRKGVEELTSVLLNILDKYEFTFSFIGPVPEAHQIQHSNVLYHGLITDIEIIKNELENADVLVIPSYSEGMPNVIMEAMASGCAIIATDVGAIGDMVQSDNGWLIPPGSKQKLQAAFESALNMSDMELLEKRDRSVEKVEEKFTWDQVAKKTIDEIKTIITKHKDIG